MRQIESRIDIGGDAFAANRAAYEQLVATLRERQQIAIDGGPGRSRSIERHLSRGKLMVRDRIDMVTDRNSAFLEFSQGLNFALRSHARPPSLLSASLTEPASMREAGDCSGDAHGPGIGYQGS